MAHHYSDPNLAPDITQHSEGPPERLGATGQFPEGRLDEHDEGELRFAIAADPVKKKVLIDFGQPVAFIGMNREQAIQLGEALIEKAKQIEAPAEPAEPTTAPDQEEAEAMAES